MSSTCFFCHLNDSQILFQDDLVITIRDAYPISPEHTLIIPKRHIVSLFEATQEEQLALLQALQVAQKNLSQQYAPDGYNIGNGIELMFHWVAKCFKSENLTV